MDIYHVVNRGIDKRTIVQDDGDRVRFVRGLFVFNDSAPAPHPTTQQNIRGSSAHKRDLLVHIHAWCLMDNHYHLLLSPVNDDSKNLSLFMKKLNMGYARFFNEKYHRSGYLWQGKYKKILVQNDAHCLYLPYYIHLNPLDFKHKNWRQGAVQNQSAALQTLNDYRWSSYLDYNNQPNFPSVLYQNYLSDIFSNETEQKNQICKIITNFELAENSRSIET